MRDVTNTLPDQLPGINVAFGLKQCLGKRDLLMTLLEKFWEDYHKASNSLGSADHSQESRNRLLHDIQGAATNIGLSELSERCQQLRDLLNASEDLAHEPVEHFHMELEKIGGSIKTLDSLIQS
jgi:HPt (histidine-containing phosphotransfer) domain-containing protein